MARRRFVAASGVLLVVHKKRLVRRIEIPEQEVIRSGARLIGGCIQIKLGSAGPGRA